MKTKVLFSFATIFSLCFTLVTAQNWECKSTKSNDHINALWFTDAQHGTAMGFLGCYYKTSDGGVNWAKQTSFTSDREEQPV